MHRLNKTKIINVFLDIFFIYKGKIIEYVYAKYLSTYQKAS